MSLIISVLITLLVINLLIVIHELGHFVVAKLFKVAVRQFSIGIGPAVVSFRLFQTPAFVRAFPLGGFVEFAQIDTKSVDSKWKKIGKEYLYDQLPSFRKMIIILAGIVFNIILAYILGTFYINANRGVVRLPVRYKPIFAEVIKNSEYLIIVDAQRDENIKKVIREYPVLVAIDNVQVKNYQDLINILESKGPNSQVTLRLRASETEEGIVIQSKLGEDSRLGILVDEQVDIFWSYKDYALPLRALAFYIDVTKITYDLLKIALRSFLESRDSTMLQYSVGGPVGLIPIIGDILSTPNWMVELLLTLGLLSWNLALFNLIPFPGLDGWHLLLALLPVKKQRNRKMVETFTKLGLLLLIFFAIIITIKDFNLILNLYGR